MKKIIALMLCLVMMACMLTVAAYAEPDTTTETPSTETPSTETPSTETPSTETPSSESASKTETTPAPTVYPATKGVNGSHKIRSGYWLSFGSTGPSSEYVGILIDGKSINAPIVEKDGSGSRVDLKPEYLDTLKAGNHTAQIIYKNGKSEVITFTIVRADVDENGNPITADSNAPAVWAAAMLLSMMAMTGTAVLAKKN